MLIVKLAGKADDEDKEQLTKCLQWIGYKVLSIEIDNTKE